MTARTKKNPPPDPKPMTAINVRIPEDWHEWLERRAARVPGFKLSDVVRIILKAEKDREEARDGRR